MSDLQSIWLKALGSAAERLPRFWLEERPGLLRAVRFPARRPSLQDGDLVLYYAAGWQKIFGAAQLVDDPRYEPRGNARWPWIADVDVFLVVPDLDRAPDLRRAKIDPLSVRSKSHIRLTGRHYREAIAGLAEAAGFDDERYGVLTP